jgi:hypothetical protein
MTKNLKVVCTLALVGVSISFLTPPAIASPSDPPCAYTKWRSLTRGYWKPNPEFTYEFNASTIPSTQPGTSIAYNTALFARRILSGANTWRYGRNSCDFYQDGGVQILRGSDNGQRRADDWTDSVNTVDLGGDINLSGTCPGPGKIGCTHHRWAVVNGQKRLREIDVRLNPRKRWWTGLNPVPPEAAGSPYDLWSIATHEFGHAIGIAHPTEDESPSAAIGAQVMYRSFAAYERRNRLQGSDYTAMCTVYPDC